MIDIEKCKREFIKYTEKFDLDNPNIKRKQLHSLRVMEKSNSIAKSLNLNEEEVEIATLIGLLHDTGRFEQYTKYKTFRDCESIDHADFGVKILMQNDYINEFITDKNWIDTIFIAIKNHNKYKVQEGLSQKQEIFCKIIRDADKADIMYEGANIFWNDDEEIREMEKLRVKDEVYKFVKKNQLVDRKKLEKENKLDSMIIMLCFIFDIYFGKTFEIIEDEKSIDAIFKRFNFENQETREKIEDIHKIINKYVTENKG